MLTWLFAVLVWFGPPLAGWFIGRWWSVVLTVGLASIVVLSIELTDSNADATDDFFSFGVALWLAYTAVSTAAAVVARQAVKNRRRAAGG